MSRLFTFTFFITLFASFSAHSQESGQVSRSAYTAVPDVAIEEVVNLIFSFTNQIRTQFKVQPLNLNTKLMQASQAHSKAMSDTGVYDHFTPGEKDPVSRMVATGACDEGSCPQGAFGENIAMKDYSNGGKNPIMDQMIKAEFSTDESIQALATQVMNGWMNDKPHRDILLKSNYTDIGIGVYLNEKGEIYFTQDFIEHDAAKTQ